MIGRSTGKPIPAAYVKVFARLRDGGTVAFHKDSYTDLRGWADYATVTGGVNLAQVERFAILVQAEGIGALVLELDPPVH